jgi:tetratricopeptide (TPR) repeat protein
VKLAREARRTLWLCVLLALSASARAETEPSLRERAYYDSGRALYTLGQYEEAARQFMAGYQVAHNPVFLLNVGQSYRRMNAPKKALEAYRQFLAESKNDDSTRVQAQQMVEELERAAASEPEAKPEPAPTTPAIAVAVPAHATPPKRSGWRKYWWLLPLSAAVAGGVAVGIYFGVRPSSSIPCGSGLGCLDAHQPQ